MYVTPAQLANGPDSLNELSELFGVAADLLRATINGSDRSAWGTDETAAADDALARITAYCLQATGEIDAYLVKRGYTVPMDATQFPLLSVWGRSIARYHLHPQRDRTTEDSGRIERDYRDARKALEMVATGDLMLGAGDPLAVDDIDADAGSVRVVSQRRKFSRTTLGSL